MSSNLEVKCLFEVWAVQFSRSVASGSLQSHGLQHSRLPYPSPTSRACSTPVHWVSDAIQPFIFCCPVLLLPSICPSIRVFSSESFLCIMWPKYWSFSISPSNEYSELISLRIDWFDFLLQQILESLLQHHSSKAPILQCSGFFMVQLWHPYMTTGKIIALTRWTFFSKVISLLLTCCLGWS